MDVKSFLFSHTPMVYSQRYLYGDAEFTFLDVTDDRTGDLLEQAKKNLLPYAKELTNDAKVLKKLKLKTQMRAVYDSKGSLHYILCKGNRFYRNQEYELFVSFECVTELEDDKCSISGSVCSSRSNRVKRVSEGCPRCLELEGKDNERVPGFLNFRKQVGTILEEEVDEILDFLLANEPESLQARFRMRFAVDQLLGYCNDLLFYSRNVPRSIITKIYRLRNLFPRKDGRKEQDMKYMMANKYVGTFVRVNFKDGVASGVVEAKVNRGKEVKYLIKCYDTEILFLSEEEVEKCNFKPRFGHLCI